MELMKGARMERKKEYEIIQHSHMNYLEIFLVEMTSREPHGHADMEIGIVLDNDMELILETEHIILKPMDLYVLNPYQVHAFFAQKKKGLILAFQIHGDLYRHLNFAFSNIYFKNNILRGGTAYRKLYPLLLSCACAYFQAETGYELICASDILQVLYILINQTSSKAISEKEQSINRHAALRLNRMIQYMTEHYTEKISLEEIAAAEHISPYYASHFITEMLGVSFQEYISSLRFEHAFRLVRNSDLHLLDICLESGFSSTRYLNRMFKKKTGFTAKEYRQHKNPSAPAAVFLPTNNLQRRIPSGQESAVLAPYLVHHAADL